MNIPQTHSALLPQQVEALEAIAVVFGVFVRSGRCEVERWRAELSEQVLPSGWLWWKKDRVYRGEVGEVGFDCEFDARYQELFCTEKGRWRATYTPLGRESLAARLQAETVGPQRRPGQAQPDRVIVSSLIGQTKTVWPIICVVFHITVPDDTAETRPPSTMRSTCSAHWSWTVLRTCRHSVARLPAKVWRLPRSSGTAASHERREEALSSFLFGVPGLLTIGSPDGALQSHVPQELPELKWLFSHSHSVCATLK
jgi:hypothetical protein